MDKCCEFCLLLCRWTHSCAWHMPDPSKSLESDLMEDLVKLQSLIRGEEVARDELRKWLGLGGE